MAFTQVDTSDSIKYKRAPEICNEVDADGFFFFKAFGAQVYVGSGAPTAGASGQFKAEPKGIIVVDITTPDVYIKTSAAAASVTFATFMKTNL